MGPEEVNKWLDEQIQKAREYRAEKGKPAMTPSEEAALRERLMRGIAR
jgi:hypothetical protein